MCRELENELEVGRKAAIHLVEHLINMGAARVKIPLEIDGVWYEVNASERQQVVCETLNLEE